METLQKIFSKIKGDCEDLAEKCTFDEIKVTVIIATLIIGTGILYLYFM